MSRTQYIRHRALEPYVELIRYRASKGEPIRLLAREYNRHPKTIQQLVDRETWTHIR